MVRKVLALLAGVVMFFVVTMMVQLIGGFMFGMPGPDIIGNVEKMAEYVERMPLGAFVFLLLSYITGSFSAGFVMRIISRWDSLLLPIIVGTFGTIGWIFNIAQIRHPVWVTVIGFFCYIPFAIFGHRAAASSAR